MIHVYQYSIIAYDGLGVDQFRLGGGPNWEKIKMFYHLGSSVLSPVPTLIQRWSTKCAYRQLTKGLAKTFIYEP